MQAMKLTTQSEPKQLLHPDAIKPSDVFLDRTGTICVAVEPIRNRTVRECGIRCAKVDAVTGNAAMATAFVLRIGEKYFPY